MRIKLILLKSMVFFLILSFGLVAFDTTMVLAEDETDQKYYIGLKAPYIWVEDDFDELDECLGYGLIFGATRDIYTCEISYSQSKHDVLDSSPKSTVKLESLNLSVKFSPSSFKNKRYRPYGIAGWGGTKLTDKNFYDDFTAEYGTARYEGTGFHLGFGMNYKINEKIAIDGSITYYRFNIDKFRLFGEEEELDDVIMTNTVASLGLQYYF